jgi:hypothetical protein
MGWVIAYSFLIHEPRIRTIIYHFLAKHRRRELSIHLLGVQISMLAIENELIPFLSEKDGSRLPEQDEGEAIPILGFAVKKELVRINAILNTAANERKYVKDDGRSVPVGEVQLPNHIADNGDDNDEADGKRNRDGERQSSKASI